MSAAIAFAASAGMLAAFNPCGFALLPGYLTTFLGQQRTVGASLRRALLVAAAVTTGFVAVFGVVGVAVRCRSPSGRGWPS